MNTVTEVHLGKLEWSQCSPAKGIFPIFASQECISALTNPTAWIISKLYSGNNPNNLLVLELLIIAQKSPINNDQIVIFNIT